ncbi:hypothetical protein NA8A_04863 [Nitratireductor indicus C115]|uniref:Uncharacterized protein n=2 Tax=Nitratireductor indicus TaxID=721133 RepID=K2NZH6_9HYPH|nr:hypothetical protein NA8A_04863 [Nitratireductor indicus C115]
MSTDFELTREDGLTIIRERADGSRSQLTLGIDYSFPSGLGNETGTSIELVAASLEGDRYILIGYHPEERLSDFLASISFDTNKINAQLDALTLIAQEHRRDLSRAWMSDYETQGRQLQVLTENRFWLSDADGNMKDGGSGDEISNAQGYAIDANAAKVAAQNAQTGAEVARTGAENAASYAATKAAEANASAVSSAASQSAAADSESAANAAAVTSVENATEAAMSAGTAVSSADSAATSAGAAASAQVSAEAARDQILALYDAFDDRYLGEKGSDPATDNDGDPLVGGALYFNSTTGVMMVYTGSAWVAAYVSGTGFVTKTGDTMTGPLKLPAGATGDQAIRADEVAHEVLRDFGDYYSTSGGLNIDTDCVAGFKALVSVTGSTGAFPPISSNFWHIQVENIYSTDLGQRLMMRAVKYMATDPLASDDAPTIYVRYKGTTTWGPWTRIVTDRGGEFKAGINFGSEWAAASNNLSRHIALYGSTVGINAYSNGMNHVVEDGYTFSWYQGGSRAALISGAGHFYSKGGMYVGGVRSGNGSVTLGFKTFASGVYDTARIVATGGTSGDTGSATLSADCSEFQINGNIVLHSGDLVSQAEAEAGVATEPRVWSAERVAQAIAALAPAAPVGLYTGSDSEETDFPVGHIVSFKASANVARNATVTLRLSGPAGDPEYSNSGAGTVLAGTWKARGITQWVSSSDQKYLAQRVS